MNSMGLLGQLLIYLAQKQNWAGSDKAGGILHILVPVAEGQIAKATVMSTPAPATAPGGETANADGSITIHLTNHGSLAAAIEAAASFGAKP